MTHTYAILEISQEAYNEIRSKIEALGIDYQDWLHNDGVVLPNIKLKPDNFLEQLNKSGIRNNSKY